MTTKEFTRRLRFYAVYDSAAKFFLTAESDFCYRVVLDWSPSHRIETCFVSSIETMLPFNPVFLEDCNSLYFDKFTRDDFFIQFKYFHSFFNRCSLHQKKCLIKSQMVNHLLDFIGDEAKLA